MQKLRAKRKAKKKAIRKEFDLLRMCKETK